MAPCSLLATKAQACLQPLIFVIFLVTVGALAEPSSASATKAIQRPGKVKVQGSPHHSTDGFLPRIKLRQYVRAIDKQVGVWDMVQLIAFCSLIGAIGFWRKRGAPQHGDSAETGSTGVERVKPSILDEQRSIGFDAESTDPGLLKKHSTFRSYTTQSGAYYPRIRTFYRPHSQADKLPSVPTPLPLLVFVHGLGGSLAQFNALLTSLVNVAPCLGIDLPGCGLSDFSPTSWKYYTPTALVELLAVVVEEHAEQYGGQGAVLIGHSMGCSLSALLASPLSPLRSKSKVNIVGLVAICPRASAPSDDEVTTFRRILRIPTPIFDIWRRWDRRGGPDSRSVARFVGQGADFEAKRLQERFNAQSRTAVWRRMAWGILPTYEEKGHQSIRSEGLPGLEIWSSLQIPLFLITGEADNITKPEELTKISQVIRSSASTQSFGEDGSESSNIGPQVTSSSRGAPDKGRSGQVRGQSMADTETTVLKQDEKAATANIGMVPAYTKRQRVLKTCILPAPASHALLYDPTTYRTLAGLIQTFLYDHIDSRLSLGWQLQHLTTGGKWDVKNLAKWQAVRPVSEPIAGIFRAMKTLRQIDETHCPDCFVSQWSGKIKAVIDISHESPVYDPKNLDEGGIEYHKFPTVSKIPPTPEETRDFIKLVDRLRAAPPEAGSEHALIGVHCHYGFNRTGFFICSYLIEREGYGVQQAIDEFGANRPPGIRHEHFLDTLFVRYCVGLKRAPTL